MKRTLASVDISERLFKSSNRLNTNIGEWILPNLNADIGWSDAGIQSSQLRDSHIDEDVYINDFEEFPNSQKYIDAFNKVFNKDINTIQKVDEEHEFDIQLKEKGENTIFDSIADIDKTFALKKILEKTKLSDLSGEIMKIAGFVKILPYFNSQQKEAAMTFLVSLDYLVKGLFTHWQITLMDESEKTKNAKLKEKMREEIVMMKHDIKYNILIGDQFHAKAYHMTTRLGNNDLSQILTIIEENFAKIIFRDGYNGNKKHNLKKLYKDFYNYLPTFFGHGFKGVAIIFEMGSDNINESFKLGIEYGFWIQFGIFSYIMTAIQNSSSRATIKTQLKKISSLVQLLSIETLQEILKSISILSYTELRVEFAQISLMHAQKWNDILNNMNVEDEVKQKFQSHINEFSEELIEITGLPRKTQEATM